MNAPQALIFWNDGEAKFMLTLPRRARRAVAAALSDLEGPGTPLSGFYILRARMQEAIDIVRAAYPSWEILVREPDPDSEWKWRTMEPASR